MLHAKRSEVWQVDLGLAAKARPAVILVQNDDRGRPAR